MLWLGCTFDVNHWKYKEEKSNGKVKLFRFQGCVGKEFSTLLGTLERDRENYLKTARRPCALDFDVWLKAVKSCAKLFNFSSFSFATDSRTLSELILQIFEGLWLVWKCTFCDVMRCLIGWKKDIKSRLSQWFEGMFSLCIFSENVQGKQYKTVQCRPYH